MKLTLYIEPAPEARPRGSRRKASDEQIVESYTRLHNIWKVGAELGMCGQSVWERLKRLGYKDKNKWTEEQLAILKCYYATGKDKPVELYGLVVILGKHQSNISRKARELGLTSRKRTKSVAIKLAMSQRMKQYLSENGHPNDSREPRTCPICGRFYYVRKQSKQKYCSRRCQFMRPVAEERFTNRKGGRREDIGNVYFRSSYEANYARYLNFLIKNNCDIERWEFEPQTFEFSKIKKGTRFYTPDFKIYFKDGHVEYHEVKGWDYPKGKTARKRFAKYYPHLKLILIDEEFFRGVKHQGMDKLIPGWE